MHSHNLNNDEILILKILSEGFNTNNVDFNKLEENKYIKIIGENIVIRQKGKKLVKDLNKNLSKTDEEYIKNNINEFRKVFKGLKPGSMGSLQSCKEKLTKWFEENPNYNFNDVIKAAKIYIKSVNDLRFLQRADYFIYKQDKNGTINSTLSAFIDEIDNTDDTWTTNLK